MKSKSHYNTGKMFAESIDVEVHRKGEIYYVCISFGETYYETDPYSKRDYALSEAKGYLEGLDLQLENALNDINKQLEEGGNDED